jgi:hypothetical protein
LNNNKNSFYIYIKRVLLGLFLIMAVLLTVISTLLVAVQLPFIQTRLTQFAASYISEKLNYPTTLQGVNIMWLDYISLQGVAVKDTNGNDMIKVHELHLDYSLSHLIKGHRIHVDEARLIRPEVNVIIDKYTEGVNIDDYIRAIIDLTRSSDTSSTGPDPVFTIGKASIKNGLFTYTDERQDKLTDRFDYYHIKLDSIDGSVADLRIHLDTLELQINSLKAKDIGTGLQVHNASTFFRFSENTMTFDNLDAHIGNSRIRNYLRFDYASNADFSDFNEKIKITATADTMKLYSGDLALFAPELLPYQEYVTLSGNFQGRVNRFKANDMRLFFGTESFLVGNLNMNGLPEWDSTFIDMDLIGSRVIARDLRQYVTDDVFPTVEKFGKIDFAGSFKGLPSDFFANGAFRTNLGRVVSEINLKLNAKDINQSTYDGYLETYDFDIGALADNSLLHKLDMSGTIQGKGFTVATANMNVDADINRIGINKYDYRNISINAGLSKRQFEGSLAIKDTNLVFNGKGKLDLRTDAGVINIKAHLEKANLTPLNISESFSFLKADMDVNVTGLKPDDILGKANFSNLIVSYQDRDLNLDSLTFFSEMSTQGERYFRMNSELAGLTASGDFQFTEVVSDFERLIQEYSLIFENNPQKTYTYYRNKKNSKYRNYHLDFDINLKDINPVALFLQQDVYVSPNTKIEGSFYNGYTSVFAFNTEIDTLVYKQSHFYKSQIDLTSSKVADSTDVVAALYVFSKNQDYENFTSTEGLRFDGTWSNRNINFRSAIAQANSSNAASLIGNIAFLNDRIELKLDPSNFHILENDWHIATDNLITVKDSASIFVRSLELANQNQRIAINGNLTRDPQDVLHILVNDFDLNIINELLEYRIGGIVNGNIELRDVYNEMALNGQLKVDTLMIEDFIVGNAFGTTVWDNYEKKLNVNVQVERMGRQFATLEGVYMPQEEEEQLNLFAHLKETNVKVLEPFLRENVSEIEGMASGSLRIVGRLNAPDLIGSLDIKNGQFRLNYLNTLYKFNDKVYFREGEISFDNVRLVDVNGNRAQISRGGLYHDGFNKFVVSLEGQMTNFQILNTTARHNELYYGNANATGNLSIFGPFSDIDIKANLTSEKGTRIYIPIDTEETIQQQSFIKFVGGGIDIDSVFTSPVDLSGIKLDLNLDITPDAYVEILLDRRAGDMIHGNGHGKLKLAIDTRGDFSMFGNFEIDKGRYRFTFLDNIINKEFMIKPGSMVTWNGDPLKGILDIRATYEQTASLLPIIIAQDTLPEMRRRYPTNVTMDLVGDLLSPTIKLGIEVKDYPGTLHSSVESFKNLVRNDEQELNRQVFSLLILRSLVAPAYNAGMQNVGVYGSISELLSNQLSSYLSQIDRNLEVSFDFNMANMSQEALNALQLRVSYATPNGKWRFTRNGAFTNGMNQANTVSLIGDWMVEYNLTEDGKVRLKMFTRNNQNMLNTSADLGNGNSTSGGFTILHTQSFDNFKDLFQRKKKTPPPPPDDKTVPEEEEEEVEVIITAKPIQ